MSLKELNRHVRTIFIFGIDSAIVHTTVEVEIMGRLPNFGVARHVID